jgi:hypothetical protein
MSEVPLSVGGGWLREASVDSLQQRCHTRGQGSGVGGSGSRISRCRSFKALVLVRR